MKIASVLGVLMMTVAQGVWADRPVPDLRDLDLAGWNCLTEEEGEAHDLADASRNKMKNRPWVALTNAVPAWTYGEFLEHARRFDEQIGVDSRKKLTPAQAAKLAAIETQIVALTGWVTLAYPGPRETCNCGSAEFHDWHVELLPVPLDHVPRVGDPTAIICETTPRTEAALYRAGVRLQKLAAFWRQGEPPHIENYPTGGVAHKVRVTGYLMWDDGHNKPGKDIGKTIAEGGNESYHHPWRPTAWEVHPILKIEDLGPAR